MGAVRRGLPIQIWGSITGETLRLLIVSAMTLVGVIAFAVAVKPLSEGKVGASAAMTFMTIAMVPMLQYALPFAGGFAATLAYHRLSADNEGLAAMAGGLGHRWILAPAAAIGLALAIALGVASNTIIPRLFHAMERVLTRDAASVILSSVESGQSVVLGERKRDYWEVFAGNALRLKPEGDARDHLALFNVLAVDVGRDGAARGYISAERVDAWFFDDRSQDEPGTAVQLRFSNALRTGADGGVFQEEFVSRRLRVPGAIRDDPKFLTWNEMSEVERRPEMLGGVEQRRRELQRRLAALNTVRAVRTAVRAGSCEFLRPADGAGVSERLRIFGSDMRWTDGRWAVSPEPGMDRLRLERIEASGAVTLMSAASIEVLPDESPGAVRLVLNDVLTAGRAGEPGTRRDRVEIAGLRRPGADAAAEPQPLDSASLLVEAGLVLGNPGPGDTEAVAAAARDLRRKIKDVRREVMSKRHERLGYAAASLIMVVTGAVVGMRLRDSLPLPVYLWSFLPALFAVITVSAGQGLAHKTGSGGLFLLWGGVAALAVYTYFEYRKLRTH